MTVKELIQELQNFPEDMEVFSYGQPCSGNILEATAMKILPVLKYVVKDEIDDAFICQRSHRETAGAKKCLIL